MKKILLKYKSLPVQVKASIWFLLCSFFQKGISILTTPIFTRLLTTSEYGQYSVFDSWLRILTIFISMQLYLGVYTQGLVKFSEDSERFSSSLQGLSLVLSCFWMGIYLIFRSYWNELFSLSTIQMISMLIMIWSSSAFSFWASAERVKYRYRNLVLTTMIISIAKPLISIILVKNLEDRVTARVVGLTLVELLGYSPFFAIQISRGKCFFSKQYWKYALCFNIPLIPHYLSQQVLNSSDRIMIQSMVGNSEAGIYALAYSVSQIMILFNTALSHTLTPWIYQKIKDDRSEDISKIVYSAMSVIAVANLTLIAIAPEAIHLFAPKSYSNAMWIIPPVAMSTVLLFSYDMFAKFEFYFEKTHLIMIASIMGAGLNIILNYIFIGIYGYYAAGYTTLLCYGLYTLFHYIFMKKICREKNIYKNTYSSKFLVPFFLLFFTLGFFLMSMYNFVLLRYCLLLLMGILTIIFHKKILSYIKEFAHIKLK